MDSHPPNPNPKILSSSWADKVRVSCSKSRFALKNVIHNLVGDIPKISVPPELISSTSNKWERCLVGFFPGSSMPFHAVKAIANRVWGPHGLVQVFASDGFFVFRFSTEDGLLEVLQNGPWMFGGKAFILLKWVPTFVFNKNSIKSVPVWAKLHGLPLSLWTEEGLSFIASIIGMPIACDKATHDGTRLAYARVCVQIEAAKKPTHFFDLVTTLSEEPIRIKVEYEWKPKRCPTCCVFGHNCTAEKLEAPKQGDEQQNACVREDGQNGKISKAWVPVKKLLGHGKDKRVKIGSSISLIPAHVDPTVACVNTSCSMEKCVSSFSNTEGPTTLLNINEADTDRPICADQGFPALQNKAAHEPRDSLPLGHKDLTLACLAPSAHLCAAIDKAATEYSSDEPAANVVGPMCSRQSNVTMALACVNPCANIEQYSLSSDRLMTANDNSMGASNHVDISMGSGKLSKNLIISTAHLSNLPDLESGSNRPKCDSFMKKGFLNQIKPSRKEKATHPPCQPSLTCIEECYSALWEDNHNDNLALVLSKLSDFEDNVGPDYSDEDLPHLSQAICGFNTEASLDSINNFGPLSLDSDTDFSEGSSSDASYNFPHESGKSKKAKKKLGRKANH